MAGPSARWIAPTPPAPVSRPMLVQEWRDCTFLHWRYPPGALRPHVPASLGLDLHDGHAWVTLVAFSVPHMRLGPLPPVPGIRSGVEANLRTYVVDPEGRRGMWMLSMDFAPLAVAAAGRFPMLLPYWWASIDVTRTARSARYVLTRLPPGRAEARIEVSIGRRRSPGELRPRDHFLTARWLLFAGAGGLLMSVLSNHPPWPLREAGLLRLDQTVLRSVGLPDPDGAPLVQFSDGVVARLDRPRLVPVGIDGRERAR